MENNLVSVFSKNQLGNFIINSKVEIDITNFLFAIILSTALAFFIKISYIKLSKSLNDKEHFSEIFVPLAIITTLVITVIKFSLALSLGLVGALSIVRFRAAIKEPEELVYLFFVIAIGLANGANQYMISMIATFIIILVLFLRKLYNEKLNNEYTENSSTNILQIEFNNTKIDSKETIVRLKKHLNYLNLKSHSSDNQSKQFNFWFDIDSKNLDNLIREIEKITLENKEIKIQVFSRSGVYE